MSETRKIMTMIVKQHAQDIDNPKVLARMAQRSNGTMRNELNEAKLEITKSLSLQEHRLTEVENGYN